MPHDHDCPYHDCGKNVADWFLEWYPRADQYAIGRQRLAMDCPWCRRPVIWREGRIVVAPPGVAMSSRSYDQAARYAAHQPESYASLEAFLGDPQQEERAEPYRRNYWPEVNVN